MSVVFSGTNQGKFISDGTPKTIVLKSAIDYFKVINLTTASAAGANTGVEFYWQRGMTQGLGLNMWKTGGTTTLNIDTVAAGNGFYYVDSSTNLPGPAVAARAITGNGGNGGFCPLLATFNTSNMVVAADNVPRGVVRISGYAGTADQIGGIDFSVARVVNNASFDLVYAPVIADAVLTANSYYRMIPYDPLYYPTRRFISRVAAVGAHALVTLTVTHTYVPGQKVRFIVPRITNAAFGMTQLDGLAGTIIATGIPDAGARTNTILVDIDVSTFTAFAWPILGQHGTFAQVVPFGEDMSAALALSTNYLADSVYNDSYTGIQLIAGANSPGGVVGNEIYWIAGTSFSVDNA
jgi:hypothetical protein